ncbi:bifunctional diaminohydroxyphosphoribosylaminopyrimidine deaminase/5-amino-6-(5-phosphoribosylamino)uracil reductase RibD [Orbaceae bacterium ESL0721]|nr:bifunctional diaminohydroxyphosphoribosylaminopyrimidine deaminase/5-amino-6-(5-phosphoribosylamino)uracil reductase RibD [Orbaceae bacterium ESL0721]
MSDLIYMQKALMLAKQGRFTTSPNPNVGSVIVKDNQIIGEGYHQKAGEPHAEVHALKMAGQEAKGATAYVTLEPCSHFGRTPPCADALIDAGVKRVVVAMQDPNPAVSGKGIERLRSAGITVDVGLCKQEAEALNRAFFKRMRTGLPYVQLKMAASLDGKIAMASGESKWITSTAARQDVQTFRAQASAILSTHVTVKQDNASLTVRHADLPAAIQTDYTASSIRQPVRVIIDSQNRLTGKENLFKQSGEIWIISKEERELPNSQIIVEPSESETIHLPTLLTLLGEKQINSLWVEAGAHLAGSLIEQNLVDELIIYYAPKLLGNNALDMSIIPNIQKLALAPQFKFKSINMVGDDLRVVLTPKKDNVEDS